MDYASIRLFELMESRKITAYRLSKDVGLSSGLVSQWKSGLSRPSLDKLARIADYFCVPITYFTEKPPDVQTAMTDPQRSRAQLLELINGLPDDKLEQARKALDIMLGLSG